MAHICTASLACHAEVNFTLVSMGDDVMRSRSIVTWFLYSPPKKLVLVPVASATVGGQRDCPVLAPVAQWPEIQPLVSRGQIVSADLP